MMLTLSSIKMRLDLGEIPISPSLISDIVELKYCVSDILWSEEVESEFVTYFGLCFFSLNLVEKKYGVMLALLVWYSSMSVWISVMSWISESETVMIAKWTGLLPYVLFTEVECYFVDVTFITCNTKVNNTSDGKVVIVLLTWIALLGVGSFFSDFVFYL